MFVLMPSWNAESVALRPLKRFSIDQGVTTALDYMKDRGCGLLYLFSVLSGVDSKSSCPKSAADY